MRVIAVAIALVALVCAMSVTAFAASSTGNKMAAMSVSTVSAMPEETVEVTVSVDKNPGLASLKFDVTYDKYLTLDKVTLNTTAFGAYVTTPPTIKNPQTITMISPLADVTAEGVLATLTFTVAADAHDNYIAEVSVAFNSSDVYDSNFDLEVSNGGVSVRHGIPGDINGDFLVDTRDAITLFRYVAGWDVKIYRGQATTHTHTVVTDKGYAATCTENGLTDGSHCDVCGAEEYSEGIVFTLNEDGESYAVTGSGTCTDADIIIPSIYNGLPVTVIGKSAFDGCENLTSITIPVSVVEFSEFAIAYCYKLETINYAGNKGQWDDISKHYTWSEESYNYTINYLGAKDPIDAPGLDWESGRGELPIVPMF